MHYDEFDEGKYIPIAIGMLEPLARALDWYITNVESPYHAVDAGHRYHDWLYSQGVIIRHPVLGQSSTPMAYYKDEQSQALFLLRWS